MKSISGVLFGIMLFLASFGVLYWNEGRVDMSDIAKKAVIIQANNAQANTASDGLLISASGEITADPATGDDLYLKPGPYFAVERHVDVYAWVEEEETVTRSSSTGEDTTETEYTYTMQWVDMPADASDFHEPEGHTNPTVSIADQTLTADAAMVDEYSFTPEVIDLPELSPLVLKGDKLSLTQNASLATEEYIYVRNSTTGTYQAPKLGDVRISYSVLAVPFEGTVFGELDGSTIDPFVTKKGDTLYRVFAGSHDESLAQLHGEYTTALWAFRLFGMLMMWFGLALLFSPLNQLLHFIPVLGGIGRAFIGFVTFAVALVLSAVTILISAILHNVFAVIIVAVLIIAGVIVAGKISSDKKLVKQTAT